MNDAGGAQAPRMSNGRTLLCLVLIAGVFVMDGYDLNAMPLAAPRLAEPLGLSSDDFGWVFSAPLFGLGAGAALLAPLGDRVGRRLLIVTGCLAVALVTLATAHATTITGFLIWRFLTGLALGACLPNCTAMSAELAPDRLRATVMSVVSAGIVLGAMGAGISAPAVTTAFGWQGLFYIPAIFAALVAVLLWFIIPGDLARPVAPKSASRIPQLELLRAPWLFPFAIFAGALTLNAANLYLLTSWTPTVLPQVGFTADQASYVTGLMQGVGLVIGIAMSLLIDRWKPGVTLVAAFALMAGCFATIAMTEADPTLWTVLLLAGVGTITGTGMALPALTAYLFPAHVLSSAMGMGVLVARVGAIAGPLIGQAMLKAGVEPGLILGIAALPAVIGMVICLGVPAALRVRSHELKG
ncbi:MFS transporter [Altererythrobacter xixiisoli]|uniref:MFS transporter n=1 Tax=Croceibacterium xixiisoli TaxID=1476466 RepID=A0A6I4TWW5_9SPHN|nr:MFS transporter [Croceibacterium xixiisoli]MXP00373.1 MFS transporter [Croceibacterium xixiisoli]